MALSGIRMRPPTGPQNSCLGLPCGDPVKCASPHYNTVSHFLIKLVLYAHTPGNSRLLSAISEGLPQTLGFGVVNAMGDSTFPTVAGGIRSTSQTFPNNAITLLLIQTWVNTELNGGGPVVGLPLLLAPPLRPMAFQC